MREWSLAPGDPLVLSLAADFRFCVPDYINDHIWELDIGDGDPPALSLQTTYGLRVRSMRLFPRFSLNERTISNPETFPTPPTLRHFFPNYLSLDFSPFSGVDVVTEYWIPDSHSIAGRFRVTSHENSPISLMLEQCGQLIPLDGQSLAPRVMQSVYVLAGCCTNLAPVVFFTGGPKPGPGPYPSLAIDLALVPGETRILTWAEAALASPQDSLELARKTAARSWDAERTKIEMVNAAETFEVLTGDPDWDAAFAFSQKTAFGLFFCPGQHLPDPSFVLSRQVDQGFSLRGDGSDYPYLWSGQSLLESYYLASLLPGAADLIKGLVRNFLAVQLENGEIDWKPGLAGQRGHWLAAPLLASLAWKAFQQSGDREFLQEIQQKLEAFTRCWFDISHDRDHDGFPEWDHPLQTGLEDTPSFSIWVPGGQGANISSAESPALAAMLYREISTLDKITEELKQPQVDGRLQMDLQHLSALLEECWDADALLYQLRDRDTHRSPVGKRIGSRRGSGILILDASFSSPVRLLIRIELNREANRHIEVNLAGQCGQTSQTELFERSDFQWGNGLAVTTTRMVYTSMEEINAIGLDKHDKVSVFVMDFTIEDVSLFLPLWAGIPSHERALGIVHQTLLAADRFSKPYGIPVCPVSRSGGKSPSRESVHLPWNQLIGEGLLGYGLREEAAQLVARLMSAVCLNLKQQRAFAQAYQAETGAGLGERNSVQGLAPLGLFLATLGVQIRSPRQVILSGKNPFPWSVTVKYRGLMVTRQANQTIIVFPDGRMITLDDPTNAAVSAE